VNRLLHFLTLLGLSTCSIAARPAQDVLRELPMRFEPNAGQWNPRVKFAARASDYNVVLTPRETVVNGAIAIRLLRSNPSPIIEGADALPSTSHYFLGNRRENWRTGVTNYRRVRYREVYPGVDLVYYGNGRQLEYDFVLRPGADPGRIQIRFRGADRLSLTAEGDLLVQCRAGKLVQKKPLVYQHGREIAGKYRFIGKNVVGIELSDYDRSQPVTIDPVLVYSSLIGGGAGDSVTDVKMDPSGMLYVAGYVGNGDITAPGESFQGSSGGNTDIFIAKINPARSGAESLVYFTYLGGSGADTPAAMALDASGNVYLTGSTSSPNFPMAGNSFRNSLGGQMDAFVLKLNPSRAGSDALIYSTYLGGGDRDTGNAIDVDQAGNIYVVGTTRSGDFPLTDSAYQNARWGDQDTFITKIDPNSSSLAYSTYLGGETIDDGRAIAVTPAGIVYFAASTVSKLFPLAGFSYKDANQGASDIVVGQMDLTKSGDASLVYATYFGGSGLEEVRKMVLDATGKLLLTGYTLSTDFPATPDAPQKTAGGNGNAFVARLDLSAPRSSVVSFSTYLGGSGGDVAYGLATDSAGNVYVSGYTLSSDFPVTDDALQKQWGGGVDIFVTKLSPSGGLLYSTYLGQTGIHVGNAIAVSANGSICVGGYTSNQNVPITNEGFQKGYAGGISDGFVTVIQP
jgi:hypothetical protein